MKSVFFLVIFCCFVSTAVNAQVDSNSVFATTKGSWRMPIDHVKTVSFYVEHLDDMSIVCFPGGVRFYSTANSAVYSVSPGTVVNVLCIGNVEAIIVKYGSYYVLYNGLLVSTVAKGDEVWEGKIIGHTLLDDNGENELEVYLTFNLDRVNKMEEWYGLDFWKLVNAGK